MLQNAKLEVTHTWRCSKVLDKKTDKIHERIATQLKEILEGTKEILSWMTYEIIVLYQ